MVPGARQVNGKRGKDTLRDRRGEVLFIDARNLGTLVDRTRRELSDDDIQKIADTYHAWRGEKEAGEVRGCPRLLQERERWKISGSTAMC